MNKIWIALALATALLFTGCSSVDPISKEKRAIYEEQKKREAIDRSQREADAGGRRLDKAIKD